MIVDTPQIVAMHRRERSVQRQDFQSVSRQIEFANDLGTEKRHDIRRDRKFETRKNFFRYGSSTNDIAALQHQNLFAGPGEVGRVNKSVVPAANNNDVVFLL